MTDKASIEQRAKAAAENLFTNGAGQKATRLVLVNDAGNSRDLGGLCFGAVRDRLAAAIREAVADMQKQRDEALKLASDEARKRGEAEGKLLASEKFNIISEWKARAEKAEAAVAERDRLIQALERSIQHDCTGEESAHAGELLAQYRARTIQQEEARR